eukprot:1375222-Amphidinium_carterae.1
MTCSKEDRINLISGSRARDSLGRPRWKNGLTGPNGPRTGHTLSEEEEDPEYVAFPANAGAGGPWAGQHSVTTKIPPGYNGTTSWFAFEEAVEDWLDITELEDARRGPALKARLEGAAFMYRTVLNRERLKAANGDEVRYFLDTLRPYFIKNKQSVFLYRFFQILKLHRGGQDINRWITRVKVVLDKAQTAWMELLIVLIPDATARTRAVDTLNLGRDPNLIQIVPDAAALAFARTELEN